MTFLSEKPESQQEDRAEHRQWGGLLAEVAQEQETGRPWWQNVGLFFVWAIGFALAAGIVVTVLLFIADLLAPGRLFTFRTLSDWLFWGSALLLLIGLVSPSASDMENVGKRKQQQKREEDKRTRSLRRRLRRVYDPWRWRFWGSALFAFGLSMLAGLLA